MGGGGGGLRGGRGDKLSRALTATGIRSKSRLTSYIYNTDTLIFI